jgi:hypothetical protein
MDDVLYLAIGVFFFVSAIATVRRVFPAVKP